MALSLPDKLGSAPELYIRQKREFAELFGVETRNKYSIYTSDKTEVAFAAEQQKGFWGFIFRYFLGHWRTFDILFFGTDRQQIFRALHPFRFLFQRLELYTPTGEYMGALQQRWGIFTKRFDVLDAQGNVMLEMKSGLFRIWTFPIFRNHREVARIEKKWSGILTEAFLDKDNFRIVFGELTRNEERALILAASVFIDLQYFEKKASSG